MSQPWGVIISGGAGGASEGLGGGAAGPGRSQERARQAECGERGEEPGQAHRSWTWK